MSVYKVKRFASDQEDHTGRDIALGALGTAALVGGGIYAGRKGWLGKKAQAWFKDGKSVTKSQSKSNMGGSVTGSSNSSTKSYEMSKPTSNTSGGAVTDVSKKSTSNTSSASGKLSSTKEAPKVVETPVNNNVSKVEVVKETPKEVVETPVNNNVSKVEVKEAPKNNARFISNALDAKSANAYRANSKKMRDQVAYAKRPGGIYHSLSTEEVLPYDSAVEDVIGAGNAIGRDFDKLKGIATKDFPKLTWSRGSGAGKLSDKELKRMKSRYKGKAANDTEALRAAHDEVAKDFRKLTPEMEKELRSHEGYLEEYLKDNPELLKKKYTQENADKIDQGVQELKDFYLNTEYSKPATNYSPTVTKAKNKELVLA